MSNDTKIDEWTLDGVLDELSTIDRTMKDRQFAFILGSGASFKSGIPTGHHLAQQWLKELHKRECKDGKDINVWAASDQAGISGLTFANAAEFYPQIFERRFRSDREAGYAALEDAMEGKSPSLGYSLLAEIIQRTRHKVVVTTNFDNLVADALAMHAHQSPLVVAHESLAGFVRPQLRRPLVAKIHRDLFLNPKNDAQGVAHMEDSWKIALKKLFQYFTPVVVGYGGNDGSLMDMLEGLEYGDIAGRIIWCCREGSVMPEKARRVLDKHQGLSVTIAGFDEFFVQLAARLIPDFDVAQIAESIEALGKKRAISYRVQIEELQKLEIKNHSHNRKASDAIQRTRATKNSWWAWELDAASEIDIAKRDSIYRQGLEQFPNSPELAGNYANFLSKVRKDFEQAELFYKKALELDPTHANITGNYANFLSNVRKDFEQAELFYKKALELDPTHANITGNYANFLSDDRKDFVQAELFYKKALELDPSDANTLANYVSILLIVGNRTKDSIDCVKRVVLLSQCEANQSMAEALLYGELAELVNKNFDKNNFLPRLKGLLSLHFERGRWSFEEVFDSVFPRITTEHHMFYRALGAAVLDESALPALERFEQWRNVEAIDPFSSWLHV